MRLPVFVAQPALSQVLDAGTANFAQARKRRRVGTYLHQKVHPGAGALQWSTKMRRPEEDKFVEALRPGMARAQSIVAGAARHQAAHSVSREHHTFDGVLPLLHP